MPHLTKGSKRDLIQLHPSWYLESGGSLRPLGCLLIYRVPASDHMLYEVMGLGPDNRRDVCHHEHPTAEEGMVLRGTAGHWGLTAQRGGGRIQSQGDRVRRE